MIELPEQYVRHMFYRYAGKPMPYRNFFRASCPVCREGNSWLKKARLHYFPTQKYLYCHNCGGSWSPIFWIKEVTGMSLGEIRADVIEFCGEEAFYLEKIKTDEPDQLVSDTLPLNSINICDESQIEFYKNNKAVRAAVAYIKKRKLDTAVNHVHPYYLSMEDICHKNRIIIPFFDENKKIAFYQSRTIPGIGEQDLPKYLGKIGADKTCFNIDKIDYQLPYYFVFEGPIDAMFVKNAIAIGGVTQSSVQEAQMALLDAFGLKRIWVLDNFALDDTARTRSIDLLLKGESVFMWPEEVRQYKDINDLCLAENKNEFDWNLIQSQTRSDKAAVLLL